MGGYSTQHSVENYNYNRVSDPNLKFHSDTENALYQEFSINGKGQEYKNMSLFSRLNYLCIKNIYFKFHIEQMGLLVLVVIINLDILELYHLVGQLQMKILERKQLAEFQNYDQVPDLEVMIILGTDNGFYSSSKLCGSRRY